MTVELCGHWKHEGACRWPHNNAIDTKQHPARFRTVFVADEADAAVVRDRVAAALQNAAEWRVVSIGSRSVSDEEAALAQRLLSGPRLGS